MPLSTNAQSKYSALLIDDDSTCNYLNSSTVDESLAFKQPLVFTNPQMALEYLQQNCLETNQQPLPELILIDINMPELTGFEFVEKLKEMTVNLLDHTLLCFLSSSTSPKDKMRAKVLGVDCYYEKPLKAEHLEELLTRLKSRS
ncbi:MAG: response regulator [Bacteroidota bacterium]